MQTLPKIPSKLIRLALNDLKLVENDSDYRVDMAHYHERWQDSGPCFVCLAGSVMAKTLHAAKRHLKTYDMGTDNRPLLRALNLFRLGCVREAILMMGKYDDASSKYDREIVQYDEDRDLFVRDMERLANDLEKDGL
jgi:hypothetical protein